MTNIKDNCMKSKIIIMAFFFLKHLSDVIAKQNGPQSIIYYTVIRTYHFKMNWRNAKKGFNRIVH
jgi:hypothetical protein